MPGGWIHLAGRFFSAMGSAPLDEREHRTISGWLEASELTLFLEQPAIDQRHGLESAQFVAARTQDQQLIRAAALHDIGKRHAHLGVFGRVLASISIKLRLPVRGRFAAYRDHGWVGSGELERAGSPEVAVLYTRHHHGARPSGIDEDAWHLLAQADGASERRVRVRAER